MGNKKPILPISATYEELLAALEQEEVHIIEPSIQEPAPEILEYDNNVIPFLSHYSIQPGEFLVSKSQLYSLYRQHVEDPIPALNFHRIVGQFIGHYRNHSGNFYKINLHQFKLSEYMFKMRVGKIKKVDKSKGWRRHFESFLKKKEIEKGTNWLEGYILQEIYRDFCRDRKKRPALGYENFLKLGRLYFDNKRVSSSRAVFFRVNDKAFNYFTEEKKNEFREERRSSKKGNKRQKAKEIGL